MQMDFRVKRDASGKLERYKARIVGRGFNQLEGVDYGETFSPIVKHTTIQIILSPAYSHGWHIKQLDIKKCIFTWQL